jgi:phage gpG-like protein
MDPFEPITKKLLATIQRLRPILVKKMGATALEFINENFEKQGFQGETFQPWAKRKDKKDQTRPLLVGKGSGLLKRSPRVSYSDAEKVIISSSLPYSKIHNEGGEIEHAVRDTILNFAEHKEIDFEIHGKTRLRFGKVQTINQQRGIKFIRRATIGAHTTKMPKRQFMGPSPVLSSRIKEMILREGGAAFRIIQ